jgi:hypothetical protein
MCAEHECIKTEFEARMLSVPAGGAVPNPDNPQTNTPANRRVAETNAKDAVKTAVAAQGELIDPCANDPNCRRGQWVLEDEKTERDLQSQQIVPVGACQWTVTVRYNRFRKKYKAECDPKPIAMAPKPGREQRQQRRV